MGGAAMRAPTAAFLCHLLAESHQHMLATFSKGASHRNLGRPFLWRDHGPSLPPPVVLKVWTSAEERHLKTRPVNEQAERAVHRCTLLTARAAAMAAGWKPQAAWMASLAAHHLGFCQSTQASSSRRKG